MARPKSILPSDNCNNSNGRSSNRTIISSFEEIEDARTIEETITTIPVVPRVCHHHEAIRIEAETTTAPTHKVVSTTGEVVPMEHKRALLHNLRDLSKVPTANANVGGEYVINSIDSRR